jgi:hypothetical protein
MAEVQMKRFRENTRQHVIANSTRVQAIDLGNTYSYDLDKIGLCTGVILKVSGTVTLSGAGAIANMGPWSLFDRIRIKTASGAALFDAPGYDCYQLNKRLKTGWGPDGGGVYTEASNVYSVPVAMGANTWAMHLWLPFSENDGSEFDSGIFGLQSNVTQATVELVTTSAGTNFVSNYMSEGLTTELYNVYFEPPLEGSNVAYPPSYVIKTISTQYNVSATGEQLLEIPRQGILLDAQVLAVFNGARSNALDNIQFRTNYGDYFYYYTPSINHFEYARRYGKAADTGVFAFDFDSSGDLPKTGDFRDAFNLLKYSKTEIVANITTGTTVSGTSFLRLLTRHWLPAQVVR